MLSNYYYKSESLYVCEGVFVTPSHRNGWTDSDEYTDYELSVYPL